MSLNRRAVLQGSAMLVAAAMVGSVQAQDKPVLRFSAVFSEQDIRAEMTKMFAEEIKSDFTLEPYFGGTLFKQGTELVALQRGNLEMGNIAAQDISKQVTGQSAAERSEHEVLRGHVADRADIASRGIRPLHRLQQGLE
jgi:TRAP-type transport system periplasmic protein